MHLLFSLHLLSMSSVYTSLLLTTSYFTITGVTQWVRVQAYKPTRNHTYEQLKHVHKSLFRITQISDYVNLFIINAPGRLTPLPFSDRVDLKMWRQTQIVNFALYRLIHYSPISLPHLTINTFATTRSQHFSYYDKFTSLATRTISCLPSFQPIRSKLAVFAVVCCIFSFSAQVSPVFMPNGEGTELLGQCHIVENNRYIFIE